MPSELEKRRARSGTRTRTPFRTAAFEAAASAIPPSGRERLIVQAAIYGGGVGAPAAMKLAGVELVQVDLPFRQAIGTAAGVHRVRPLLFVRVVTEEAEGWGECAALEDGTAVDPTLGAVEQAAEDLGVPRLYEATAARGGELPLAAGVAQLFGSTAGRPHACRHLRDGGRRRRAARRRALAGRRSRRGRGLRGAGGRRRRGHPRRPRRRRVASGGGRRRPAGAARVRLKVEPGWVLDPVRAVRADHPDLVLQVDANGSFGSGADDVALLSRLADYDVLCIEQPLPPADLVAHAQLARRARRAHLPGRVALDAAPGHRRRCATASCAMACLKPARLGGLRATRAAHAACAAAGVPTFVGGFFEAGLGAPSNLALAARLSQDATGLVSDVGDPAEYLAVDPCGYPPVRGGWVRVPTAPGVGNPPERAVLERLEVRRRWFPATYT